MAETRVMVLSGKFLVEMELFPRNTTLAVAVLAGMAWYAGSEVKNFSGSDPATEIVERNNDDPNRIRHTKIPLFFTHPPETNFFVKLRFKAPDGRVFSKRVEVPGGTKRYMLNLAMTRKIWKILRGNGHPVHLEIIDHVAGCTSGEAVK